jgi:two-component sensor histidine kinase
MMLHELATNSIKYGALTLVEGQLQVTWALAPSSPAHRLELRWSEHEGPPSRFPRSAASEAIS